MRAVPTDFSGNAVPGPLSMDLDAALGFNLGDGYVPANLGNFYKKYSTIKSHRDFFFKQDVTKDALRAGYAKIDSEILENVQHKGAQAAFVQDQPCVFEMVRNPKTGKDDKVYKKSAAEILQDEIKELQDQRVTNQRARERIPQNWTPFFDAGARKNINAQLVELDMAEFNNGKSYEENGELFRAEEKAFREITTANVSNDDAVAALERDFAARVATVRDDMLANSYAILGNLPNAIFRIPSVQTHVRGGDGYVLPEDVFAFLLALDDDGALKTKIKNFVIAANAGKRKIALKDRPELLRVQEAKFMLARRHLEFACRALEAQGTNVRRPRNTPWQVLAWCEPAAVSISVNAPGDTITVSTKIVPGKATGDDFEGDDDE